MEYLPPLKEQLFVLESIGRSRESAGQSLLECLDSGLAESVLAQSGRLAAEVFAPLDHVGADEDPAALVARRALLAAAAAEKLEQLRARRLTLVRAPGYGKTCYRASVSGI